MANYEDLLVEKADGIATVTFNAPDKLNAFTLKMRRSIMLATNDLAMDDEVRVVIVTGAGRAFSAGGDLEAMKARIEGRLVETRYERLQQVGYWGNAFVKLEKPVIAALNGPTVGAGLAIALSCDIRIASEKAKFGSVYVHRALVPDCGLTFYLPRLLGISKALELMFSGEIFDAEKAKALGIVNQLVPHDELMKVVREMAAKFAQQPPISLSLTKRLVYRSMLDDIDRHIDMETYGQNLCHHTEDFAESMNAFLEKRPQPPFKGM